MNPRSKKHECAALAWCTLAFAAASLRADPAAVPASNVPLAGSAEAMSGIMLGIFVQPAARGDMDTLPVDARIAELGHTPAMVQAFFGWNAPFPRKFVDQVVGLGSTPMITWQPIGQSGKKGGKSSGHGDLLAGIAAGRQDAYIRTWADAARDYPHTIYVRPMHEMNGAWYPWGAGVNGNTPQLYVAAFRHIVTVFRQAGAANVQFVWCVSSGGAEGKEDSAVAAFFPGDAYVDWVSMDGYCRRPEKWLPIDRLFAKCYSILTRISSRPVMIAEMGCVENPKDPAAKARWITEGFLHLVPARMPRVKAILYFDARGHGFSYPLHSSAQSFAAYRQVVHDPLYQAPAPTRTLSFAQ